MKPHDLMDIEDVSRVLEVKPSTLRSMLSQPDRHRRIDGMPPIFRRFGNAPSWVADDIRTWRNDEMINADEINTKFYHYADICAAVRNQLLETFPDFPEPDHSIDDPTEKWEYLETWLSKHTTWRIAELDNDTLLYRKKWFWQGVTATMNDDDSFTIYGPRQTIGHEWEVTLWLPAEEHSRTRETDAVDAALEVIELMTEHGIETLSFAEWRQGSIRNAQADFEDTSTELDSLIEQKFGRYTGGYCVNAER